MAMRATLQIGDPRLKAKNETVKDFKAPKIKQVVTDLIETMRDEQLIGMAAPQIGENYELSDISCWFSTLFGSQKVGTQNLFFP